MHYVTTLSIIENVLSCR